MSGYWSILDPANPSYLGSVERFLGEYVRPIELGQVRFKLITSPFIMRHVKTDKCIISDLPEKAEDDRLCHLTAEQAALYRNIMHELMLEVAQVDGALRCGNCSRSRNRRATAPSPTFRPCRSPRTP